jgi:hypothetical protein
MSVRTFPGKGNANLLVVSFEDAIELFMVLPGKVAKETRTKFADVIKRYLAGDRSMITEIEANAASDAPIAQLARASMDPVEEAVCVVRKRKLEELEIRRLELGVMLMEHEVRAKVTASYRELCEDTVLDGRARIMLKDGFLNLLMAKADPPRIEDGTVGKPISISGVIKAMNVKLPDNAEISIGGTVSRLYRERHNNEAPPKHEQLIGGRSTLVNSYFEKDRDLVERAVREYMQKHGIS